MTAVSAIMMGPISKRNLVRGPLIAGAAACLAGAAGVLFLTTGTPMNHQPQANQPQANQPQPNQPQPNQSLLKENS
jgi:hypothetical protein